MTKEDRLPSHASGGGRTSWRPAIAKSLLVSGRVLPLATVLAIAWSRVTMSSWESAAVDDAGFSTAWQPNTAMTLTVLCAFAAPFIALPVGSPALAERTGDHLVVVTVLGRRTVDLTAATTWLAVLPGLGTNTHLMSVRSRTGWVVLAASERWRHDGGSVLLDEPGTTSEERNAAWRHLARGWALIAIWMVCFFVCLGIGGASSGAF